MRIEVRWERYPQVNACHTARAWLGIQAKLGLAPNTIDAYGRALQDYLLFSARSHTEIDFATREHIAAYVRDLTSRPNPKCWKVVVIDSGGGLANATLQQRLTAIRLFYDYLVEEGLRTNNPVGRGRYTPGRCFGGIRERGLIPRYTKLPWIPNDEQWRAIIEAARCEPLRNRMMLALGYDAALRREELCSLDTADIDPSRRTIRIRAEKTKNRRGRVVVYSEVTAILYAAYLRKRRELSSDRGPLFLSESRRNRGRPISIWTWSKVVAGISERSAVPEFTTHTSRHLCLTDLARANWDIHEIALFAGHRSIQSTLLYCVQSVDMCSKVRQLGDWHVARVGGLNIISRSIRLAVLGSGLACMSFWRLQRAEPVKKAFVLLPAGNRLDWGRLIDFLKRVAFHLQICSRVNLRRFDIHVAEEVTDHVE